MQPNTPATGSRAIPGIAVPQPAPSGRPEVQQPLPPNAQQRTQHLLRTPPSRHIANQTAQVPDASPQASGQVLCVIAGYSLTKQHLLRPDMTAMRGLTASHVTLVMYLKDRPGQLITETELMGVIEVRAETTVRTYLRQLPPALGLDRVNNEQGVKCWVMGATKTASTAASGTGATSQPKKIVLDPSRRYGLEKAPPPVVWVNSAKRKHEEAGEERAHKRAKFHPRLDLDREDTHTGPPSTCTDEGDVAGLPPSARPADPTLLPAMEPTIAQNLAAQDDVDDSWYDNLLITDPW